MKIRHCNSPKAGIEEHVRPDVGRTLVAAGLAEELRLPPRGSEGWLAARKELADLPRVPDKDDVVPQHVIGVEWSAVKLRSGVVVVLRKAGCETWRFAAPPTECPASVVKQFNDLTAVNDGAAAAALEQAKRRQAIYDENIKTAKRW